MANLRAIYSVVLRSGVLPKDREVLEAFACKVESASGGLLHFMCTAVDLSHPYYIKMETFRTGEESTHAIRVPHQLVVLVAGDEARPEIGFLG